ncbi:MAG: peptidoglycan-binding domain-containing protein [Terracidiphilus sp.]
MFSCRASVAFVLSAVLIASPALATSVQPAPAGVHKAHGAHKAKSRSRRPRGQQAIEPARVTEIQQALIRERYLTGEASGKWDAATIAAMQKYQADQGWQTKLMPDSRALKKLGLGPDYSGAINAKDSSFGDPPPASTIPPDQSAGFAQAAGISR